MKLIRFLRVAAWSAALFLVTGGCALAAPTQGGALSALQRLVSAYHTNGDFVGNVLVADRKGVVYEGSFGLADRSWNIRNTPQTRFNIASMTKAFTALMILQLVHEGSVALDATISRYLPEYRSDTGKIITIDELLGHRSGLPDYANSYKFYHHDALLTYDRDEFIKQFLSGTPDFTPGSQAKYCSTGYFLLGVIIERVTGISYAENLRRRVLVPLRLTNTGYDADGLITAKRATGYLDAYTYSRVAPYINLDNFFSSAAIYSNTTDLLRWMRAVDSTALLPADLEARLFRSYGVDPYEPELSYGYGWEMGKWTIAPGLAIDVREHGGNEPGFRSMITETPSRGYVIILLENSGDGQFSDVVQQLTKDIAAVLYGRTPAAPRISLERELAKDVVRGDLTRALATYKAYHASSKYRTSEYTLVKLTDELIDRGHARAAVDILKLAASYSPKSSSFQGAMGDAYIAVGDKVNAIQCYRNVLLINPQSARAKQKLSELGISTLP